MQNFTPGLPTRKTLVFTDNNGNRFSTEIDVNPGAPGADGTQAGAGVSSTLGLGAGDQPGVGLGWDSSGNYPFMSHGSTNNPVRSNLIGTTPGGVYQTDRGNGILETTGGKRLLYQHFFIQNAHDGTVIPFPQQFADNEVAVFLTPSPQVLSDGRWILPYVGAFGFTRSSFVLTRYFTDPSLIDNTGWVNCVAIGAI